MSSHEKALKKAEKHHHKKGKDSKCAYCGKEMGNIENSKGHNEDKEQEETEGGLDEKNRKPSKEYGFQKIRGAKNNDTENDK